MGSMSFRRSVAADTRKKGGKGGRGNWHDRWRLSHSASAFMLVEGEYLDQYPDPSTQEIDPATGKPKPVVLAYYKYKKHRRKLLKGGREDFRDEVCSAGPDAHNPQPCVGCYAMDTGDKSVTLSDGFAVTALHLNFYHKHPLVDTKAGGGIVMKKDQTGPVMVDSECTGRTCNFCRTLRGEPIIPMQGQEWPGYLAKDIGTFFGKRRYMELGKNHLGDLIGWDRAVGSQCGGNIIDPRTNQVLSPCRNQLTCVSWNCQNCKNVVIDMATDSRTDEQIQDAVMKAYPCMTCQRNVFLEEVVACDKQRNPQMPDAPYCSGAKQFTVFKVVLTGLRQGESTNSHLFLQRFDTVEDFGRSVNPQFLNGKSFKDYIEEIAKPFDFTEVLAPRKLEDQAKRLELALPPSRGGGYGQGQYGAPPQQNYGYGAPATTQPPGMTTVTVGGPVPQTYTGSNGTAQPPSPPFVPYGQQATPQPAQPQQNTVGPPAFTPPGRPNFSA
jgi:hypothetical protein